MQMSVNERYYAIKVCELLDSQGYVTTDDIWRILGKERPADAKNVKYVYSADRKEIRPVFEGGCVQ